jgi:hypothetical protein
MATFGTFFLITDKVYFTQAQKEKERNMSYKIMFALNAIVVFALGLILVVAPKTGLSQFNMDLQKTEAFVSQALGAALTSLGLALWFAKEVEGSTQRNLGIAALAGVVIGLIVTIIGTASGIIRVNGWIPIVVEALFGLGYGFVIFLQPRMK